MSRQLIKKKEKKRGSFVLNTSSYLSANLVPALAGLDMHDFPHGGW